MKLFVLFVQSPAATHAHQINEYSKSRSPIIRVIPSPLLNPERRKKKRASKT